MSKLSQRIISKRSECYNKEKARARMILRNQWQKGNYDGDKAVCCWSSFCVSELIQIRLWLEPYVSNSYYIDIRQIIYDSWTWQNSHHMSSAFFFEGEGHLQERYREERRENCTIIIQVTRHVPKCSMNSYILNINT